MLKKTNKQRVEMVAVMDEEEKEFMRIQTDVQIWLGLCLGCFASMIAALIAEYQAYSVRNELNLETVVLLGLVVFLGISTWLCANKAISIRKKMDKPLKK